MKVKDLIHLLQSMPDDIDVLIMEGKKHDDNAPLMEIRGCEFSSTDQDEPACIITIDPNPDTIVPLEKSLNPDLVITAEIMRQSAKAVEPFFPGKGFALVVFDFGEGLREFKYISNARRYDMIATFDALIAKWKNENIQDN